MLARPLITGSWIQPAATSFWASRSIPLSFPKLLLAPSVPKKWRAKFPTSGLIAPSYSKKQRPPDRRKAALWAFCFSLSSFPHRFVKGHDRASLGLLASLWQITGKLNGRPGRYSRAARFFLALLHALRAFNHKNRPIPHVLRVFNHKISCFRAFSGIKFNFLDRTGWTHFPSCCQVASNCRTIFVTSRKRSAPCLRGAAQTSASQSNP